MDVLDHLVARQRDDEVRVRVIPDEPALKAGQPDDGRPLPFGVLARLDQVGGLAARGHEDQHVAGGAEVLHLLRTR